MLSRTAKVSFVFLDKIAKLTSFKKELRLDRSLNASFQTRMYF